MMYLALGFAAVIQILFGVLVWLSFKGETPEHSAGRRPRRRRSGTTEPFDKGERRCFKH
jgi:hypothetical protein